MLFYTMSIATRFISFLRSPLQSGTIYCGLFIFLMAYVGAVVNEYYHKQEAQSADLQLVQYEYQLNSKLDQLGHLIYAIDAFLPATSTQSLFHQVAHSQLSNSELPISLEVYHAITASDVEVLEKLYQENGSFDFRVQVPDLASPEDSFFTIVNAAPLADYGHTLGESCAMKEAFNHMLFDTQTLQTLSWQDGNKWSLILPRPQEFGLQTAIGLSFELSLLLEGLFSQVYQNTQQHLRVLTDGRVVFNSDWQDTYQLAGLVPKVSRDIDFNGRTLRLQLYTKKQLNPNFLTSRQLIIIGFVFVASICGILVWLQLRALANRNQTINNLVIERTASLDQANQKVLRESDKRLQALQQQVVAERKYKSLFVNSREGLFVLNHRGQIVEANPAFKQLLMGESASLEGAALEDFILDEEVKALWQQVVVDKQQHKELDWLARSDQHGTIWLRQSGHWLHHPDAVLYEGRITDITQDKLFNEQLKYKARHDSLTDLLNRLAFLKLVDEARESRGKTFILLYIDLDRFKLINDTLGHLAGDKLLVEFAGRMQLLLGSFADIARLGGDEFAVLFDLENLERPLEGILEDMLSEIRKPFTYKQHTHSVSGSIGVRTFTTPCTNVKAEKLLHDADIAMYEAKKRGKNAFHIYTRDIACQAARKIEIERALQDISLDQELSLNFQPIYCQRGKILKGFEALLRWQSPSLGFVSPAEFIPIAEECAKITMLGQWVFAKAMAFMKQHSGSNIFMSVNVSPLQLQSPQFMAWLTQQFTHSTLQPEQFKIELTESAMMATEDNLVEPLEVLHEQGFGIYIDDFGTGYSSLARLNHLPVDGLKIDRAFIEGIESGEKPRQLIEAICAIAKSFNLVVTAEGIEQSEQLDVLVKLHCQQTQGYYMSRPLNKDDASSLCAQQRLAIVS